MLVFSQSPLLTASKLVLFVSLRELLHVPYLLTAASIHELLQVLLNVEFI
jgi:hypothetical protein